MRVPTVRVKHPALGFVTINASDFTDQHELHEEQAEGFDDAHLRRTGATSLLDPALRDAAAALCLRMVAFRRRAEGAPFTDLSAVEQLAIIGELGAELDAAVVRYDQDQRERADYEARDQECAGAAEVPRQSDGIASETGSETPQGDADQAEPLRVAKGPRGLWYVWRGAERLGPGLQTEEAAQARLQAMNEG